MPRQPYYDDADPENQPYAMAHVTPPTGPSIAPSPTGPPTVTPLPPSYTAPYSRSTERDDRAGYTNPAAPQPYQPSAPPSTASQTGSGDTGYDWLGFVQGLTGSPNTSRGGSNGGFIPGGGQYRGHLQPVVDQYNARYGTHATAVGDDKIDFGDGRGPQDVITSGGDFWYGGPPGSMQGQGGGGQVGSVGANGMLTGSADAGGNDFLGTFRQAMLDALHQFQQPTDLNSPTLQPQLLASRVANQRGIERARQGLAEQAYAHDDLRGNDYGQQQQQLLEHAAAAQGQTEGGLVDTAEARRQSVLQHLLQMGSSQGLQQLLATASLAQQKELFGDQLGFNYANLASQQNRDALLAALGYYDR